MDNINFGNVELKVTAGRLDQLPDNDYSQVVFAGRSNVGKSSLINSLTGRKKLAKISQTPGKTVTLNFYEIDRKFYLVDLPGYGYAKRSEKEKRALSVLTDGYFTSYKGVSRIKCVAVLVDSRIGPTPDDCDMMDYLYQVGLRFMIVATKTDKLNATERRKIETTLSESELCSYADRIIYYSSLKNSGRDELRTYIRDLIGEDE